MSAQQSRPGRDMATYDVAITRGQQRMLLRLAELGQIADTPQGVLRYLVTLGLIECVKAGLLPDERVELHLSPDPDA